MIKNLDKLHEHVLHCYPQEAVGFVFENLYLPKENVHSDPANNFALTKEDSLIALQLKADIIHSHTSVQSKDDIRTPSFEDMQGCFNTKLNWGIVACDGSNVSDILYFGKVNKEPYEGRIYISNVFDCFTLVRDYVFNTLSYDIGLHPRPADWFNWNPHYIDETWKNLPFAIIAGTPKEGDIVLMNIASPYTNHLAVYIGNDEIIHHLHGKLSCKDTLSKWKRQIKHIVRYYGAANATI